MKKKSFVEKIKEFNTRHRKIVPYIIYLELLLIFLLSLLSYLKKKIKIIVPVLIVIILLIVGISYVKGRVGDAGRGVDSSPDAMSVVETQTVDEAESIADEKTVDADESTAKSGKADESTSATESETTVTAESKENKSADEGKNSAKSQNTTKVENKSEYSKVNEDSKTSEKKTTVSNNKTAKTETAGDKNSTDANKADAGIFTESSAEVKENLKSLSATYPEVIGWLLFEDDLISYPIMYSGDNKKYVEKDYTGKDSKTGAIFLDYRSSVDFSDFNSIVYGHNMKDYSMFGAFKNYKFDNDYLKGHEYFRIVTSDGEKRYQIFAYMDVSKESEIYSVTGTSISEEKMLDMLNTIEYKTYIDTGIEPDTSDRIVTLSTCTAADTLNFVMFAVKVGEK